ncbi:MAG: SCO family protein [Pirellulaceae bacterium]
MNIRWLNVMLWIMVLVFGAATFVMYRMRPSEPVIVDGRYFEDVPWKHLANVERFQLTNQDNKTFDSASLDGQVYAVSFFFSTCPTICRDLNRTVSRLNEQMKNDEIRFVTISVDPDVDTPDVLKTYAPEFGATAGRWDFLTGQMYRIKRLGEDVFRVVIDKAVHTDNILLIDKWGRFRDRFKWDDPLEMKRFVEVARELMSETEPPLDTVVNTRCAMASTAGVSWETESWVREFRLTDSHEKPFYSRDITGKVWIANFFFTSCPTICPKQMAYLSGLRSRVDSEVEFISISTDPVTDTPLRLSEYAQKYRGESPSWRFLTGPQKLIPRISAEFFKASSGEAHHSTELFVVDRWHQLRGRFDWQKPEHEAQMMKLIAELQAEREPKTDFELVSPE